VKLLAAAAVVAAIASGRGNGTQLFQPVFAPSGAQVAWVGDSTVWIANPDGSSARPLHRFDDVEQLTWASPGSMIVDSNFTIFRLRLDGTVVQVARVTDTTFSADAAGTRVATGSAGCPVCHGAVEILTLASRRALRIGLASEANSTPGLSPDGRRVAYSRSACPGRDECTQAKGIWVAPTAGTTRPRRIAPHGVCPVWARDGRSLAFVDSLGAGLQVVPARGGRATIVERRAVCGTSYPPVFSPDSTRLAFVDASDRLAVADLARHRIVFRTAKRLARVIGLAWSPDGRSLLMAGRPGDVGCSSLWRVDAATGAATTFRRCS
jgi:hypothetical protein